MKGIVVLQIALTHLSMGVKVMAVEVLAHAQKEKNVIPLQRVLPLVALLPLVMVPVEDPQCAA
jgi:hypothetical protein